MDLWNQLPEDIVEPKTKYLFEKRLDRHLVIFIAGRPKAALLFWLLAVPRRLFCFGSLVILDVARYYLWLFTLYINIKIGKNSC